MADETSKDLDEPLTPIELEPPRAIPAVGPSPDPVPASPIAGADQLDVEGEGIYCPICNYNLTGILSGRCPECGSMFHREALLEAQRSNQVTLIPWECPGYMPMLQRLGQTLRICLFKPDRFAFAFSVQPQRTRAWSFFVGVLFTTLGITTAIVAIAIWLDSSEINTPLDTILNLIGVMLFTALLVAGTTLATSITLWLTNPHYDGLRHFTPWLSICCYASSHYLMVAIVLPFALLEGIITNGFIMMNISMGIVMLGCGGLCGFTLKAVMNHRTARHRQNAMGPFLLVVIYLTGPICAVVATGLIGEYVSMFLR